MGGWIEREENLSQEGLCWVSDDGQVCDNGRVSGDGWVSGNGRVFGDAWVCGDGRVCGDTKVCGDMVIQRTRDYLALGPMGPYNEPISFGQDKDRAVVVCCSGFYGTLEEFARKVEETHGDTQFGKEYRAAIELAKEHFLTEETK